MTVFSLDSSLSVCWFFLFVSQYKEGKKLKPKPNYNSVDLSEVEWEDTEEKVRERNASIDVCLDLQHKCFYNLWQMSWWACDVSVFQLRTAMVKGDTGTLALDVKATVDKGVSTSSSTTIQWYFTKDILSLSTAFMIFFFVPHRRGYSSWGTITSTLTSMRHHSGVKPVYSHTVNVSHVIWYK